MSSRKKHYDPYDYLNDIGSEPTPAEKILQQIQEENRPKEPDNNGENLYWEKADEEPEPLPDDDTDLAAYQEKIISQRVMENLNAIYHGNNEKRRQNARDDICSLISKWGLKYIEGQQHYSLSRDEKHIIRMDYYGTIGKPENTPTRSNFSPEYSQFINNPYRENLPPQNYNLSFSPNWKIFRQFKRFRQIEPQLIEQLQAMNIPSELLPKMNAYDFSDVLYERFKNLTDDSKNAILFLGARRSFIKDFIRRNEKAFRRVMHLSGIDDRYTNELVKVMKAHGSTINVFVVEYKKAANLLRYYVSKKLLPENTVIGDEISAEQINFIRSRGDYLKVAVLNDEGKPLTGPTLSVHHKIAVKDAGDKTYLAEVNDFENLCLTVSDPYHRLLHALDITETVGRREKYKARIYMDNDIVYYGGLHQAFQIKYDYSKDERTLRHKMNRILWQQQTEAEAETAGINLLSPPEKTHIKPAGRKEKKRLQQALQHPAKAPSEKKEKKKKIKQPAPSADEKKVQDVNEPDSPKQPPKPKQIVNSFKTLERRKIEANRQIHRYGRKKQITAKKIKALQELMDIVKQGSTLKEQTLSGIINGLSSGTER